MITHPRSLVFIVILLAIATCQGCEKEDLDYKLVEAATKGNTEEVRRLVALGADMDDSYNDNGKTALIIATEEANFGLVMALLEEGADPDKCSRDDDSTALLVAVQKGYKRITRLLLMHGAEPTKETTEKHVNPLNVALEKNDMETLNILLRYADKNSEIITGTFVWAAKSNRLDIVEALVRNGAEVNGFYPHNSPLLAASANGHINIVKTLIAKGASVNGPWAIDTPLMQAVNGGHADIVTLLLASGANVNEEHNEETALDIAEKKKQGVIAEILLKNGAKKSSKQQIIAEMKEAHYGWWTGVAVWVIDDFGVTRGHGDMVVDIIRKEYQGLLMKYDAGNWTSDRNLDGFKVASGMQKIVEWSQEHPTIHVIVNVSWGSKEYSPQLKELYETLTNDLGFSVVAAAGNDGKEGCSYPAGYPGVIGVSTVVRYEIYNSFQRASYANYGKCVSLYVPEFTDFELMEVKDFGRKDLLENLLKRSGTSFSAARATGAIAAQINGPHPDMFRGSNVIKLTSLAFTEVQPDLGRILRPMPF
jgi:ankyrin repeat protein